MNAITKFFRVADWPLTAVIVVLIGIGLIAVWSFAPGSGMFLRQLLWAALGLAAFFFFGSLDYRIFRNHGMFLVFLYLAMILALAGLLLFGKVTHGVRGWFQIGSANIQPVEVMKLVLVLVLSRYFSRRHVEIGRIRHLVISGLYVGIAALLVMLQPDLGGALILGAIWIAVVFFSGIHLKHLFVFLIISALAAGMAWVSVLKPYQQDRIKSFVNPYRDPRGTGYNTIQAMIAAGSGRVWGKGIGFGTQSHLNFLPESETDFIFSAFAEETGFIGALILLILFGALFWRILAIGARAQDNFSKLYVLGFASLLFSEAFIHIAINIGLLPVTGIVLPLISYGGSSMITTLAGLGILQSIRINSVQEIG